jgi:hypothetical protein
MPKRQVMRVSNGGGQGLSDPYKVLSFENYNVADDYSSMLACVMWMLKDDRTGIFKASFCLRRGEALI